MYLYTFIYITAGGHRQGCRADIVLRKQNQIKNNFTHQYRYTYNNILRSILISYQGRITIYFLYFLS